MRFKIYNKGELKTGLRFDFIRREKRNKNIKEISILEEDIFTIEPIFYKFFKQYNNFGHWGTHTIRANRKIEFIQEIKNYIECLENKTEIQFYEQLNNDNFGSVYEDINNNRDSVIFLAKNLIKWIDECENCEITICGI